MKQLRKENQLGKPTHRGIKIVLLETLRKENLSRIKLNKDRVTFLADLMKAGVVLPPIIISDDHPHDVIDGQHRIAAAARLGRTEIDAEVRHYEDKMSKIADAINENFFGPTPLTTAEKRECIEMMIRMGASRAEVERAKRL
jgi:ParB-like chromosome segregation protein Spo0J